METNIVMKRDLNWFIVRQNTKNALFNANDLLEIYNKHTGKNKKMEMYVRTAWFQETKEAVLKELNLAENLNTTNMYVLEKDVLSTNRGKVNWGTRMHPYLFIDFAMWLSPEFKVKCIKWIYDNVINLRIGSGDSFKEVNMELRNKWFVLPTYYKDEANMINFLVFGSMESGQRDTATEKQLDLLERLQKLDTKLIKEWLTFSKRAEKLSEFKDMLWV